MRHNLDTINILTVQSLSQLSGVSAHLIRIWERRYSALEPDRSTSGRRIYNNKDLARLRLLKELTATYPIGQIANLTTPELHELAVKTVDAEKLPAATSETSLLNLTLDALAAFRIDELVKILERSEKSFPLTAFLLEFVSPLFSAVGARVSHNQLSVAQEHLLSALLRDQLGRILHSLNQANTRHKEIVALATPEGDMHEFGILISAILFALNGFRIHYFGPNIPAETLARAARALRCTHVTIGMTFASSDEEKSQAYLKTFRSHAGSDIKLFVGGGVQLQTKTLRQVAAVSLNSLTDLQKRIERPFA